MKNDFPSLPVAVIGAGPIGLAAAAHLIERGFTPLVLEAGPSPASHLESYRHVQLFSPWQYDVDPAARRLLEKTGWTMPQEDSLPTAGALIDGYLAPLASHPVLRPHVRFGHRVLGISREGFDKMKSKGREAAPFIVRALGPGGLTEIRAWAVIDASGTWGTPNPLGANGMPALGELENADHIAYGMPDILGRERSRYAGKKVVVAGAGHSAAGDLLSLAKLAEEAPGTRIAWIVRGRNFQRIFGGGAADGLPARGALGLRLKALMDAGRLETHPGFLTDAIHRTGGKLTISGHGEDGEVLIIEEVDEVIVAAGGRPDLSLASELRVKLDPWIESTESLAPLIDPNVHSCGTVRPHGHRELSHPEPRFYAVGAKSYGRAPNFLLATGHEQVRSVVAALAGDITAADDVQLVLPETGVCSTQFDEASSGCCTPSEEASAADCGGSAKRRADACCALDEKIKDAGGSGCGSRASQAATKGVKTSACCR